MKFVKKIARYILPFQLYQEFRSWAYHTFELKHFSYTDYKKIINSERYQPIEVRLKGRPFKIIDNQSFLFMHDEIFVKEIYKFIGEDKPYIIDCGANVGVSIIYFKEKFPTCRLVAFEPDPTVYQVLCDNLNAFNISDVTIYNKALGKVEGTLDFYSEGSDSGRLGEAIEGSRIIQVESTRLSRYLTEDIDLLKIDIEGAETDVLEEIRNKLHYVRRIFIEYHSFRDRESTLEVILVILKDNGFKVFINSPGLTSIQPFVSTPNKNGMDMQLNIYGYKMNSNAS